MEIFVFLLNHSILTVTCKYCFLIANLFMRMKYSQIRIGRGSSSQSFVSKSVDFS